MIACALHLNIFEQAVEIFFQLMLCFDNPASLLYNRWVRKSKL